MQSCKRWRHACGAVGCRDMGAQCTLPDESDLRMRRLASCSSGAPRGVPAWLWDTDGGVDKNNADVALRAAQVEWQEYLGSDEMVAAQHASASTVVGGPSAWRAMIAASQWRDAMRILVQEGLHAAATL